jgi:DNA modification methylase
MKTTVLDRYHIGDAREISAIFPQHPFVDTTITSPPYWNLKDYGSKKQVGFGQSYDSCLDDLTRVFKGVYDITKETGSLWIVADTIKDSGQLKLFPFDLAERLKKIGWILHDIIVWHKDKTLPWSHRGKLRNIFEYILFFSKSQSFRYHLSRVREADGVKGWWKRYPERYSPEGKAPTRTWSIPIPRQGSWGENWVRHFCPLPPELVRRIVLLTSSKGNVVLDPFAGSGVVLAQAKALERRYVGLDLRRSYRTMFENKVLTSIAALEDKKAPNRIRQAQKRRAFSTVIWQLRKTKYPRELLRLYEKKHGRVPTIGMIAASRGSRNLTVTFLFPANRRPSDDLMPRLKAIMKRPPLSKYGLRVLVKYAILTKSFRLPDRSPSPYTTGNYSVYTNGKTYCPGESMDLKSFLSGLSNGLGRRKKGEPALAANVHVRIPKSFVS